MVKLFDSHCHIHDKSIYEFALSRQKKQELADFSAEKIFGRMKKNGVVGAICVGTTHEDSMAAGEFASKYDNVYFSYGIHPEEVNENSTKVVLSRVNLKEAKVISSRDASSLLSPQDSVARRESRRLVTPGEEDLSLLPRNTKSLVAIGEVGLDYHSERYDREGQIRLFEAMIDLALKYDLPMIFHVREAFDDFYAILDNFHGVRGVVHSFSDTTENMEKALGRGFYIGVNGLATFANLPIVPIERVLLETDSPFLAPIPFRGRVNDPSHILDIAKWLSSRYHLELEEVAEITTSNTNTLFEIRGLN